MSDLTMKYNPAFLDDETLIRTFVVRHREFDTVMEAVRENTGDANQHVLVIGPRGSGKSTLALRVAAEVRQDPEPAWYPVVYGEESYTVMNAGEFWLEALFQVAEQTGEPRWRDAYDELQSERDADRLGRRALAQLMDFADERGERLLLIVENLHQLLGSQFADDDEVWTLRKTLQTEPRLMLLGTATRHFGQIEERGQALYEFFRLVDFDPLDSLDEIADLWALADDSGTPQSFMRPVEILTGGNPRLIRILSEFAARTSFRELMDNLVHLMDEHTEYFKHHLDALAPSERKVFVGLADLWDPSSARDVAEAARMETSAVSAQLARLVARGAVRVTDTRGRTKIYQVAERLYNVYHLMRRRGQASARVRAAVRFMVRYYEGDRLIPAVRALVHEARDLSPEHRRDHYIAYSEVLDRTGPTLRARILSETGADLCALPDLPETLRERVNRETNPYAAMSVEALVAVDPASLDEEAARRWEAALSDHYQSDPTPGLSAALLDAEDRILVFAPRDARAHRRRGALLAKADRCDEALDAYDHALTLRPDDADMHGNRGNVLSILGRYDEALDAYDRALTLRPNDAALHYNRGIALADSGRRDEALDAYDRAITIQPDDGAMHHNRGVVLMDLERYDEAIEAYDQAITLQPDDAGTHYNRGNALWKLGRLDEALDAYDRAITLRPDDVGAHCNRGVVLMNLERYDEALDAYDHALTLRPDDAIKHYNRGNALSQLGRYDKALEAYNQALTLRPDDASIYNNCGNTLWNLERHDEALHSYDQALSLQPDDAGMHRNRLVLLSTLDRPDEALTALRRLVALPPDPSSLQGLAFAGTRLAASGRTAETLDLLQGARFQADIEPLLVALRLDLGETVDVAQEIREVAEDILADIHAERERLAAEDG